MNPTFWLSKSQESEAILAAFFALPTYLCHQKAKPSFLYNLLLLLASKLFDLLPCLNIFQVVIEFQTLITDFQNKYSALLKMNQRFYHYYWFLCTYYYVCMRYNFSHILKDYNIFNGLNYEQIFLTCLFRSLKKCFRKSLFRSF